MFLSGAGNDSISVEQRHLGTASTVYGGAGNDGDHRLGSRRLPRGRGGGSDYLDGGDGNDTLWGGGAGRRLDGGAGQDLAVYADNTTPVLADLRTGRVSFPGQTWAPETLVGIEGIETGSGNDTLIGTGGANELAPAAARTR